MLDVLTELLTLKDDLLKALGRLDWVVTNHATVFQPRPGIWRVEWSPVVDGLVGHVERVQATDYNEAIDLAMKEGSND